MIFPFALLPWFIGVWLDSYKRTSVLLYDLDDTARKRYEAVVSCFDAMLECNGKWHVEARGAVEDLTTWKRNAGAKHLINKKPTSLDYRLPAVVKSNLTPPALHLGRHIFYFFPDGVLIEEGLSMGAVSYKELQITSKQSNFIEEGNVPKDAQITTYTWKHPNLDGSRDRRFGNNYQIPVCCYEEMHLTSTSGINKLLEFSRIGVTAPFANALKRLPKQAVAVIPQSNELAARVRKQ